MAGRPHTSIDRANRVKSWKPHKNMQSKGKWSHCFGSDHYQRDCPFRCASDILRSHVGLVYWQVQILDRNLRVTKVRKHLGKSNLCMLQWQKNLIVTDTDSGDQNSYSVFHATHSNWRDSESLQFLVDDEQIKFIPDSGEQVTLLPKEIYDKHKDSFVTLQKCMRPVYSYMANEPLVISGQFCGEIIVTPKGSSASPISAFNWPVNK